MSRDRLAVLARGGEVVGKSARPEKRQLSADSVDAAISATRTTGINHVAVAKYESISTVIRIFLKKLFVFYK